MMVSFSIRLELGHRRHSFSLSSGNGEIRGEVDDSASAPLYLVQHCVVDTHSGQVVLAPTHSQDRAEDLAARLNSAMIEPPAPESGGRS